MNTDFVLQAEHLKKHFGTLHAVEDISLSVKRSEIFGFLGPNGAGKTTTISMILGLTYPTAGTVSVLGESVTPTSNRCLHRVGTLVGAPALMLSFSARRNLQALACLYPDIPATRVDEVLELVDLKGAANRAVRKFSTGMKQRLGLGLALFNKPDLLILDEPTNGMDPAGMQEIRQLLRNLAGQGITVFLSSHLLHEMELICDRVAVVQKGKIISQGKISELLTTNDVIHIHSAQLERTASVLHNLPGAQNIQLASNAVAIQGIPSEQVISFLVSQDLTPQEVTIIHPDLESIFLQLTHETA